MRRTCFGLHCLALAIICLTASGNAFAQAPPSSIQLFMPNGGGPPSRSIRLTLARDDGYIDTVFTDSNGKYLIATPKNQTVFYTVTIETDNQTYGTTTASLRLDLNNPNQTAIFLRPLPAEKSRPPAAMDVTNFEGNVPGKARAAYKRGMDLVSSGQLETAVGSLEQAINIYPEYVSAINDLGVIFLKLNRLDEAAARFRQATDFSRRFFHPRMNLGIVLTKQSKYKEALEILQPLYEENHGMLEVRLAYARALEGAGQLSDAEKIYRSTLESKNLPPATQADMHFCLGVLLNRQRRFGDAVAELQKAIAINDAANSHLQLGAALMQLQQPNAAEHELLRAYELGGPSAGAAQLLLGNIYYAQQRFGDAQRALEQYLKDMPSAPNAPQVTKLIADLKTKSKD